MCSTSVRAKHLGASVPPFLPQDRPCVDSDLCVTRTDSLRPSTRSSMPTLPRSFR